MNSNMSPTEAEEYWDSLVRRAHSILLEYRINQSPSIGIEVATQRSIILKQDIDEFKSKYRLTDFKPL